jgi:hypothetical protein
VVNAIGTAGRFAAAVTVDELRTELAYPLDEAGDGFFRHCGWPVGQCTGMGVGGPARLFDRHQ